MRVGITGANSEVGRAYVRHSIGLGHHVTAFVRVPDARTDVQLLLGSDFDLDIFAGLDCVIHLAWDRSRDQQRSQTTNLDGARRLVEACKRHHVYPHLLSTMSAYANPRSHYGYTKNQAENIFVGGGGTYVRAGLIWGGEMTPILRSIRQISSLPLICPHLTPTSLLFHSFEDALISASLSMCEQKLSQSESGDIVAEKPVSLKEIQHEFNSLSKRFHLSVSSKIVYECSRMLERVRVPLPFRSDSLASFLGSSELVIPNLVKSNLTNGTLPGKSDFFEWLNASNLTP